MIKALKRQRVRWGPLCVVLWLSCQYAQGGAAIDETVVTREIWVAPDGDPAAEGIDAHGPTTLQNAIDQACGEAGGDTRIRLLDGEYRPGPVTVSHNATVRDKSPGSYVIPAGETLLILEAVNPGQARITGSDPVTATGEGGGVYSAPWTRKWGVASQVFQGNPGENGSVLRRELLFVNDIRMTPKHQGPATNGQPVSRAELTAGEFTVNEAEEKIYFKPPAGVTMGEETDVQVAVRGTGLGTDNGYNTYMRTRGLMRVEGHSNLVFRGLVFERNANYINVDDALCIFATDGKRYYHGAAGKGRVEDLPYNVLIEDCAFRHNNGTGLGIKGYRDVTIRGSRFLDNGERGLHTGLVHNLLAEDLLIENNGWRFGHWLSGHTAAGWKHIEGVKLAIPSRNVVVRRSAFRGNTKGLWQDYGGVELTVDRCLIEDNMNGGFDDEMTDAITIITDSVIRNNGYFNVRSYGSPDIILKNTLIYGARPNEKIDQTVHCNNFLFHNDDRDNNVGRAGSVKRWIIDSCTIIATETSGNNWWLVDWRARDNRTPTLQAQIANTIASDFNTWFVREKPYYGDRHFFSPDGQDYHPNLNFESWQSLLPTSGYHLDLHSKWEDPGDGALDAAATKLLSDGQRENLAPSAIPLAVQTAPGQAVAIDVMANCFDADGDAIRLVAINLEPKHGAARLEDNLVVYTPIEGYTGGDVLRFTIEDEHGATDSAMVMIGAVIRGHSSTKAHEE